LCYTVNMKKKEIANIILDIIDCEKRYVKPAEEMSEVEELRMQLREVAFALITNRVVKASDLF
jgi:hypothetical protein